MQYHTVQLIVDDINIVQLQSCIFYFSIFFFYFFLISQYIWIFIRQKNWQKSYSQTHT